jgi:hypothetical protein
MTITPTGLAPVAVGSWVSNATPCGGSIDVVGAPVLTASQKS